jgi:hypothetical protein
VTSKIFGVSFSAAYCRELLQHVQIATSREVRGSISDEVIEFFNLSNPSSLNMALGLIQPLTETSTGTLPGG